MALILSKIRSPKVVYYDSVTTEDKYSHYIHHLYPNCLHIVNINELNSLHNIR